MALQKIRPLSAKSWLLSVRMCWFSLGIAFVGLARTFQLNIDLSSNMGLTALVVFATAAFIALYVESEDYKLHHSNGMSCFVIMCIATLGIAFFSGYVLKSSFTEQVSAPTTYDGPRYNLDADFDLASIKLFDSRVPDAIRRSFILGAFDSMLGTKDLMSFSTCSGSYVLGQISFEVVSQNLPTTRKGPCLSPTKEALEQLDFKNLVRQAPQQPNKDLM